MPTLEIKRDQPKPHEIRMGHAPREIDESNRACGCECGVCMFPASPYRRYCDTCNQEHQRWLELPAVQKALAAAMPIPDESPKVIEPPAPKTKNQGRIKKMADKKLDHESGGPETIRKDDAGDQGAIGSHGQNAPAQEKVPESKGDKEE